jgi:hypothetical protein
MKMIVSALLAIFGVIMMAIVSLSKNIDLMPIYYIGNILVINHLVDRIKDAQNDTP